VTIIIEVSRPFQARPGRYTSRVMYRFWWLWFAVGVLRVPLKEYSETAYAWQQ
jgi:hypothetical protein